MLALQIFGIIIPNITLLILSDKDGKLEARLMRT
jgi:hypothetical protein